VGAGSCTSTCCGTAGARGATGGARRVGFGRRHALQRRGGAAHQRIGAADGLFLNRFDLLFDGLLILRQIAGQLNQLRADQRTDGEQRGKREQHRNEDGRQLSHMKPPQHLHERREQEAEQHRQRDGNQHLAAEVERRHHHHAGDHRREPVQAGRTRRIDAVRPGIGR
jgi:hypothetical protein